MLDRLDDVAWGNLSHAYGAATDVPDMIVRITSDIPQVREKAIVEAYGNIFHQGTRYEATSHTVPFFLEMLEDDGFEEKAEIIYLLAHLVMGYDEYYLPGGFGEEIADCRAELADRDEVPEEDWVGWFVAITDEVRKGAELFNDLLAHDDENVRVATAFLMSWLPEEEELFVPHLWARAKADDEPTVRAASLIAIGLIASESRFDEYTCGMEERLRAPQAMERFGAAIALGTRRPDSSTDAVVQILLEMLGCQEDDSTMSLPWYSGEHGAYATEVLRVACADSPGRVVRAVSEALPQMNTLEAANASSSVLYMLFDGPFKGDSADDLHELQREFLEVLSRTHTPWKLGEAEFANFTMTMSGLGLPDSMKRLANFIQR